MKKFILFVSFLALCAMAYGQKSGITVAQTDSLPELIQYYLEETTSKHFEDPKVPRFLLKDRTDSFVFGVGGAIDARVFYDGKGNDGNVFSLSKEDESSKYDNDALNATLFPTNLVFKVLGKTKPGVIDGLINVDFGNSGHGARLLQAYIDLFGLRIGKANNGFRDDESIDVVDGNGILSHNPGKVFQVSYSYRFKNGLRAQVGFEFPQNTSVWLKSLDNTTSITKIKDLYPDLTANVFYNGKRIHLYGGVIGKRMNYYDINQQAHFSPAYAFQAGMNWAFVKRPDQTHKLYAQAIYGHGMANCCTSMRDMGLSAVYDQKTEGLIVPNTTGGYLGYQAIFGNNTIDLVASVASVTGHQEANIGDMYNWAYSGVLNYFRKIITYGKIGVEVMAARRYDLNGKTHTNLRTYLYLRYNF